MRLVACCVLRVSALTLALCSCAPGGPSLDETGDTSAETTGPLTCESSQDEVESTVLIGACVDEACADISTEELIVGTPYGSAESRLLQLECVAEVLPVQTPPPLSYLEFTLECGADPKLPGVTRFGIRGRATPHFDRHLSLATGDEVRLTVRSTFDGYDQFNTGFGVEHSGGERDGELVLAKNWAPNEPDAPNKLSLYTYEACAESPAECNMVRYTLELAFSLGEETLALRQNTTGRVGSVDLWVDQARGFRESSCGVYSGLTYLNYLAVGP